MTEPTDVTSLADRMDGDYEPPILAEPKGGPIPDSTVGDTEDEPAEPANEE